MRWDYKDPRRGDSFEVTNFFDALSQMQGLQADLFAFDEIERELGREGMNRRLIDVVSSDKPDLVFFFFFEDELDFATVDTVSSLTETVNWFADDQWRYSTYSKFWASHLRWVVTTYAPAANAYRKDGHSGVIASQWGCNHHAYKPLDVTRQNHVAFVGQPHGNRRAIIEDLRRSGLPVVARGYGWDAGRIDQAGMVRLFSESKVNLNLSNASVGFGLQGLAGMFVERRRGRLRFAPGKIRERWLASRERSDQIKGRNFEIPGCRTLLITPDVPGLSDYFEIGREVVTFSDLADLKQKCLHYLQSDGERETIAEAGYRRVLQDHTYERRFREIFETIGLN